LYFYLRLSIEVKLIIVYAHLLFLLSTHAQAKAKTMDFGVYIVRKALPDTQQQQWAHLLNTMFQKLPEKNGVNCVKVKGPSKKVWYKSAQAVSEQKCTCFYGCCCWRNNAKSTRP
jgi:hypothetical protein